MKTDIVIVNYNTRELLRACLRSIRKHTDPERVRVYVVDNASTDSSPVFIASEYPAVDLVALDHNIGFGAANNRATVLGKAPYILFLNPDAELTEDALDNLEKCLDTRPQCVIAGPRLEYPDGRFQLSCRRFPSPLRAAWSLAGLERRYPRACPRLCNWFTEAEHLSGYHPDMVSGACFLIRREYFERLGGFDEELFMYEEETDLMLPARRLGFEIAYCRDARVVHHGGASVEAASLSTFSMRQLYRSKYYCFRKHYGAGVSRRAYYLDCLLLQASAAWNTLRGRDAAARVRLRVVRRAWKESLTSIRQLREDAGFFRD